MVKTFHLPDQFDNPRAWCIDGQLPPPEILAIIAMFYVRPLESLSIAHRIAVVPSKGSCYRPVSWEHMKGRSGNSLHTFRAGTWGACDLVRADGGDVAHLLDVIALEGPWRRVCWYPGVKDKTRASGYRDRFIHVDFGDHDGQLCKRRELYEAKGPGLPWKFKSHMPEVPGLQLRK